MTTTYVGCFFSVRYAPKCMAYNDSVHSECRAGKQIIEGEYKSSVCSGEVNTQRDDGCHINL